MTAFALVLQSKLTQLVSMEATKQSSTGSQVTTLKLQAHTHMKLTVKEIAMLSDIINSEYQDGNPVDNHVWLDYVVDSKSRGGVLTSLQSKGLVSVNIVPMSKSDNRHNGISDSTIAITALGFTAYSTN